MSVVIFCSLLAIFLTYLEYKRVLKHGMLIGFLIITFLQMIHYQYGNDYMTYYMLFDQFVNSAHSVKDFFSGDSFRDPGWSILCYIFKPLGNNGFFALVAVISIIINLIYYKFIKHNVSDNYKALAVFIYVCSTTLYLLNFSMIRQGLVVAVFLSIWPLIKERKWIKSGLILIAASLVHHSALILLPFIFVGYIKLKNIKMWITIFVILLVSLHLSQNFIRDIFTTITLLTESFEDYATSYADIDSVNVYGIGFWIGLISLIVSFIYLSKSNSSTESKQMVLLANIAHLITPFTSIIPLISRISIYFTAYTIFSIPISYSCIKNKLIRIGLLSLYVIYTLYKYFEFFGSETYGRYYSDFKTIFSVL